MELLFNENETTLESDIFYEQDTQPYHEYALYKQKNELHDYIMCIKQYPLLSMKEEIKLAKRKDQGDLEARQTLINSNLRLVVKMVLNSNYKGSSIMDIIQEGNLGLINGIERYDYKKGYRISTYVSWWIRKFISEGKRRTLIKQELPYYMYDRISLVLKTIRNSRIRLQRNPTLPELSDNVKMSKNQLLRILLCSRNQVSLDQLIGDSESVTICDLINDDKIMDPIDIYCEKELLQRISYGLNRLSIREKEIIIKRFGIYGNKPLTLELLSQEYNLSKEGIRKIQNRALNKLRNLIDN